MRKIKTNTFIKKLTYCILLLSLTFASCGSGDDDYEYDSSSSGQCVARTKDGTRCKRTASKGSIYCWQHQK